MAQEYPARTINIRLADLMKEHNISQQELAKEIGCSKKAPSAASSAVQKRDANP